MAKTTKKATPKNTVNNKFVQPALGIELISSPVLTAAQVAEIERERQRKLKLERDSR